MVQDKLMMHPKPIDNPTILNPDHDRIATEYKAAYAEVVARTYAEARRHHPDVLYDHRFGHQVE